MFIYRIEDDNGQGCYRNGAGEYNKLKCHDNDIEKHPTPLMDRGILRYIEENEITGFKDLRQLKKWFTLKQIRRLRRNGYVIKKIEVEQITAYGECQILAVRKPPYEFINRIEKNHYEQLQKEPQWLKEQIGAVSNESRT